MEARTRASLIKEPFHLLAPIVEKRLSATHIDRYVGITLLLTVAGTILVANVFKMFGPFAIEHEGTAVLITLGIGLVATGIQGYKSIGRYLEREVYPKITRSLRPLKPSQSELEAVFAELKRADFKLAKKAKLKDLLEELAIAGQR